MDFVPNTFKTSIPFRLKIVCGHNAVMPPRFLLQYWAATWYFVVRWRIDVQIDLAWRSAAWFSDLTERFLWITCSRLLSIPLHHAFGHSRLWKFQAIPEVITVLSCYSGCCGWKEASAVEMRPNLVCENLSVPEKRWIGDLRRLWDLRAFGKSEWNRSKQNQITYRQPSPKVCVQQFHGQDEDQFRIFWAFLVQFGLGIMLKEGICEVWIFRSMRSNISNLEVWKIWGMYVWEWNQTWQEMFRSSWRWHGGCLTSIPF